MQSHNIVMTGCCTVCYPIIQDSLKHFDDCPIFQQEKQRLRVYFVEFIKRKDEGDNFTNNNVSKSCIEIMNDLIENHTTNTRLLRHLCSYRCFLRGYSPRRDWMALRQSIHEKTDQSISALLQYWTCCLVHDSDDDDEQDTQAEHDDQTEVESKNSNEETKQQQQHARANKSRKRKRTMVKIEKEYDTNQNVKSTTNATIAASKSSSFRTEFIMKTTGKVRIVTSMRKVCFLLTTIISSIFDSVSTAEL
jgi:hypothetical protein